MRSDEQIKIVQVGQGKIEPNQLLRNAIRGFFAGVSAGIVMAPIEYKKVSLQVAPRIRNQINVPRQAFRDFALGALKSIGPFSGIFGTVCAIQYSINDWISDHYGAAAGIAAAAISSGALLVASDHVMYRQHTKQSFGTIVKELAGLQIFTGFTPMVAREAIYLTSTVYAGPYLGQALFCAKDQKASYHHNFVGRMFTGALFVLLSHPFDSLARQMQIRHRQGLPNSIRACLKGMHAEYIERGLRIWEHPLYRGASARILLGIICGSISGTLYDYFKTVI